MLPTMPPSRANRGDKSHSAAPPGIGRILPDRQVLRPGAVGPQGITVLDVEELGTTVGAEVERLAEVEPHLMFATHGVERNAVEVARELSWIVLKTVCRCTVQGLNLRYGCAEQAVRPRRLFAQATAVGAANAPAKPLPYLIHDSPSFLLPTRRFLFVQYRLGRIESQPADDADHIDRGEEQEVDAVAGEQGRLHLLRRKLSGGHVAQGDGMRL